MFVNNIKIIVTTFIFKIYINKNKPVRGCFVYRLIFLTILKYTFLLSGINNIFEQALR